MSTTKTILLIVFSFAVAACMGKHGGGGTTSSGPVKLGMVAPLFPNNGANWNDYVAGSDWKTALDNPCNASSDTVCLHGGERRVVVATGKSSCTGLTAADDLGAFNWVCDASTGTARLVSTGLASGKSLSDLVDFNAVTWKTNKVTVSANAVAWGVTPGSTWWNNPVSQPSISVSSLVNTPNANIGNIYLVINDTIAYYTLDADKVALVIQPGRTVTGSSLSDTVITSSSNYLWIEGNIDASADNYGLALYNVNFSMLHNVAAKNSNAYGIILTPALYNTLSGVTVSNNSVVGVFLGGASNNLLSGLTANNNGYGAYLASSSNNMLSGVMASNNSQQGVYVSPSSNNNMLSGVTASNNSQQGVYVDSASNNTIMDVTASNNSQQGVYLTNTSYNLLSDITAANNNVGVELDSSNNTLADVAAANNVVGINLSTASNNTFTGLLKVGNTSTNCSVSSGSQGLDNACNNNGSSNAILTANISLATSFVGKVTSNDVANASDNLGAATSIPDPAMFDWTHFDNSYRGWGLDGSTFPSTDQQGQWTTGYAGRIWDWSLSAGDTVIKGVLSPPAGGNTFTQTWDGTSLTTHDTPGCNAMVAGSVWDGISACQTTFLRNAVEIIGDGIGNDNGLCETGETCRFTPNIGSYQGSGNLVSAGTFTPGTLTGVTLMKYATNGE